MPIKNAIKIQCWNLYRQKLIFNKLLKKDIEVATHIKFYKMFDLIDSLIKKNRFNIKLDLHMCRRIGDEVFGK